MTGDEIHAGDLFEKELPDGRYVSVIPLTFGRARLLISESKDSPIYEDGW